MKSLVIRLFGAYLNTLSLVAPMLAAKKGFAIFCKPFRIKLSDKQLAWLSTAERFILQHEQHRLQVYRWGTGQKKVLFLHGWQSHTYRWKAYIESLPGDEYSVYSVDAPGHGLSSGNFLSVPLYSEVVQKLIQEHGPFAAVVGHSLGGFTMTYTLYRFPLLPIGKLILLAPPGEANDFISVFQRTLGLTPRTVNLVADEFKRRYSVNPEFFSTARFAPSLNQPGLIIHDERDDEAPYRYAVRLREQWKKSHLITTQGLGHNLRSHDVVSHVASFINEPVGKLSTVER